MSREPLKTASPHVRTGTEVMKCPLPSFADSRHCQPSVGHDVARIVYCHVKWFVLACFCEIFRYFKDDESRGRSFQDWQAAGKDSWPRRSGESNIRC